MKRLARLQRGDVALPVRRRHIDVAELPAALANERGQVDALSLVHAAVVERDEAIFLVLLPVHVGDQVGEAAKARLAGGERAHGGRLQYGEAHESAQFALVHARLGHEVVRAVLERLFGQLRILVGCHDDDDAFALAANGAQRVDAAGVRKMQVEQDEVVMARGQLRARAGERAYRIELRHARVMRQRGEWRLVVSSHRAQIGAHEHSEALVVLDEQHARSLLFPPHPARIMTASAPPDKPAQGLAGSCIC